MPEDDQRDESNPWVLVAKYSELGFIIPAAVFLGFIVGKLLDYWLHTKRIYIGGIIFGAIMGFVEMIRMATSSFKNK